MSTVGSTALSVSSNKGTTLAVKGQNTCNSNKGSISDKANAVYMAILFDETTGKENSSYIVKLIGKGTKEKISPIGNCNFEDISKKVKDGRVAFFFPELKEFLVKKSAYTSDRISLFIAENNKKIPLFCKIFSNEDVYDQLINLVVLKELLTQIKPTQIKPNKEEQKSSKK